MELRRLAYVGAVDRKVVADAVQLSDTGEQDRDIDEDMDAVLLSWLL